MRILRVLVQRLFATILVLLVLTGATYALYSRLAVEPGRYLARSPQPTREELQAGARALGTDRSFVVQYVDFVAGAVRGDLGLAWRGIELGDDGQLQGQSVRSIVGNAAAVTGSLALGGGLLLALLTFPVALFTASRPRSWFDRTALVVVVAAIAMPPLVLGIVLQATIGARWELLPESGYCPLSGRSVVYDPTPTSTAYVGAGPSGTECGGPRDWASHLVLPWLTFALIFAALYVRVLRSSLMEQLKESYVQAARARGAAERRVLVRHALPNAIAPMLTLFALDGGAMLGAAIYIEVVFDLPGLGQLAVQSLNGFPGIDLPVITGLVVVIGLAVMTLNTLANVAYAAVDPRVRDARALRARRPARAS